MAPTVLSVSPADQDTDVVLGTPITVLFSSLMDHASITEATFSLTGPGQTQIITPEQLVADDPEPITGREYITGTFAFDDTFGSGTKTQLTFTPSKPLRPNVTYTLLILGSGGALTSGAVKDASEVAMVGSYTWTFTTGDLDLVSPPPSSPVPGSFPSLDPNAIIVIPRQSGNQIVGADLSQEIDLIFPGSVDLTSFDSADILTSIEAMLGDPSVVVPPGLIAGYSWQPYNGDPNRKLRITITGWPT
jgi:hypothetical protein